VGANPSPACVLSCIRQNHPAAPDLRLFHQEALFHREGAGLDASRSAR
jgi:hypothetical protein